MSRRTHHLNMGAQKKTVLRGEMRARKRRGRGEKGQRLVLARPRSHIGRKRRTWALQEASVSVCAGAEARVERWGRGGEGEDAPAGEFHRDWRRVLRVCCAAAGAAMVAQELSVGSESC